MMSDILSRANERHVVALQILSELQLLSKWSVFGRPVLVGAVAYNLVVSPDIDIEIYCPILKIEHGFEVLCQCALHPNVTHVRFANHLKDRDQALYWQIRYQNTDGIEWKIDMWSADQAYSLPRSENLVEPMKNVLTEESRKVILELKEKRIEDPSLNCPSIDLYRAVIDDGIRTIREMRMWLGKQKTGELTNWRPKPRK